MNFPNDGFKGPEDYFGTRIEVFSRSGCEEYVPETDNEVCISISGAPGTKEIAELSTKFKDVLRLCFEDLVVFPDGEHICDEDADRVIEFLEKHVYRVDKIVLHCMGGISRSRTTASFIARSYRLPYNFTALNKSLWYSLCQANNRFKERSDAK